MVIFGTDTLLAVDRWADFSSDSFLVAVNALRFPRKRLRMRHVNFLAIVEHCFMLFKSQIDKTWCTFLYKLFNGYTFYPNVLSKLTFLVTGHTTGQANIFYVPFRRKLYGINSHLIRTTRYVNNFKIDIFVRNSIISF